MTTQNASYACSKDYADNLTGDTINYEDRVIYSSIIGSHAWGMQTPDSDEDHWHIYLETPEKVLNNSANYKSCNPQTPELDQVFHEASHVIKQITSGNINYIMGVTTPCQLYSNTEAQQLRKHILNNPIRGICDSILGTARRNFARRSTPKLARSKSSQEVLSHWVQHGLTNEREIQKITRFLDFGITTLETGKYQFTKPKTVTREEAAERYQYLQQLDSESTLPKTLDLEPLQDWLYQTRLKDLNEQVNFNTSLKNN